MNHKYFNETMFNLNLHYNIFKTMLLTLLWRNSFFMFNPSIGYDKNLFSWFEMCNFYSTGEANWALREYVALQILLEW